jgi:Ca-activated chloride channel family protein
MKYLVCLSIICFAVVAAAMAAPPSQQEPGTLTVDVNRVNVLFTVSDKRGRYITDLKKDSFKVFEDNRLQSITNFSDEADLPLSIVLLVDTSGSVRNQLKFEQEAAIAFFRSTLKRGKDKGAVISFDSRADLLQDFTDNLDSLAVAVNKLEACVCGTAVYDAVYLAATEKLSGTEGRRVIVLISDGEDTANRTPFNTMLEAVHKNDIAIYSISNNTGSMTVGQKTGKVALQKMADETGGRAFFPKTLEELAVKFQDIGTELRSQYAIAYQPSNNLSDGTYRRIRIDVANKEYLARPARPGYTAPRPGK